ncbi:MAG: hypothetical protein ACP6IY_18680 [Promethearchaeia archaeon]
MKDPIDIEDLEAFIEGLKVSFDSLGEADPLESKGFQSQLARAISMLRLKKQEKIKSKPEFIPQMNKDELKNFLLNKLEFLKTLLKDYELYPSRKFRLVMQITKLRERISLL